MVLFEDDGHSRKVRFCPLQMIGYIGQEIGSIDNQLRMEDALWTTNDTKKQYQTIGEVRVCTSDP